MKFIHLDNFGISQKTLIIQALQSNVTLICVIDWKIFKEVTEYMRGISRGNFIPT